MKLQEVCEVYSGYALKEFHDSDEGYPVIKIGNICSDGTLDLEKCQFTNDFVNEKYFSKKGDIYVALSGATTGKIGIINTDEKYIINQRVGVVRKIDKAIPDQYIKYFLMNKTEKILEDASGCAQPNISPKQIGQYEFPKLGYSEMDHISVILDGISNVIAQRKQELQKFDDLIKARFVELFGDLASPKCKWKAEKLVDVCVNPDDIKCGPFGTQLNKDEYVDSGVAVWEIPQINSLFLTTPTHYLTEEKARQLDAYSIKPGDIAMSRKGNVGKCAVFPSSLAEGIIHSDVLRIRVDDSRVFPMFMMHQLHYSGAVQHQIELVSSGAIMAGINVTKLKQIFVHIPPMELQNQFTTFVQQVDKSKFLRSIYCDRLHIFMEQIKTLLTPIGNYCFCRN